MKKILFSFIFGFTAVTGFAQQAGLGFVVGVPRNEFRVATEAEGYGLNLTVMFPVGTKVINFGGNINYMIYGLNSRKEDLTAQIKFGNTVIDELFIPLRVVNTNSIFGMHGIIRITAPTDNIRPYFEGLFGFRYISTSTRIEDRSFDSRWSDQDDDVIVRKTNLSDFVLSYGGGGGIQFAIGNDAYLDFRAYYLLGGKANFYDASDTKNWEVEFTNIYDPDTYDSGAVTGDDLDFGAQPRNSTTDMLMVQIGVSFEF